MHVSLEISLVSIRTAHYAVHSDAMEYKLWPVKQAAKLIGVSEAYLRKLLTQGKVRGGKNLKGLWIVFSLDYKRKRKLRRRNQ